MAQTNLTPAELAQVEAAKEALPKIGENSRGVRYSAQMTLAAAAPVLTRRVIELEAEVQRLKEWQAKAMPYLQNEKTRMQFIDFDDGEDMPYCLKDIADIAALIAQAQEGEKA